MKQIVYLAHYNNGESYEDFNEWNGDVVHLTREGCIQEIEGLEYKWIEEKYPNGYDDSGYRLVGNDVDSEWYCGYAKVVELHLVE